LNSVDVMPDKRFARMFTAGDKHCLWALDFLSSGAYEGKYPLAKKGSYLFRAAGADTGGASRVLAYSYPDEYHFYPPNTELLRSISNETKGRFQPRPEDIFDPNGESTALPTPLWPYLAALALLLYLADVLLRRVRLFE
jgi:hypothetical protein